MGEPASVRARLLLAEVLGLREREVPSDAEMTSLPAWDSLAHVRLLHRIEQETGTRLGPEQVLAIRDVPAIAAALQPHEGP